MDDFKKLKLPTAAEWADLKKKLTRAQHIDFHCERLRLLNCFQMENGVRFDRTLIVPHLEGSDSPERSLLIDAVLWFEQVCAERAERVEIALDRRARCSS